MNDGCSRGAKKTATRVFGSPATPASTNAVSAPSASLNPGNHYSSAVATITPATQHDEQLLALNSHNTADASAIGRSSNPSKTPKPRQRGQAKKTPRMRQSKR